MNKLKNIYRVYLGLSLQTTFGFTDSGFVYFQFYGLKSL